MSGPAWAAWVKKRLVAEIGREEREAFDVVWLLV